MNRFNIGDRVICIHPQSAGNVKVKPNTVGTVTHICEATQSISVNDLMGYSGTPVFSPTAFELIEAAADKQKKWLRATPERIAKLEVGDMVKLRNGVKTKVDRVDFSDKYACVSTLVGVWVDVNGVSNVRSSGHDIIKIRNKEYVKTKDVS